MGEAIIAGSENTDYVLVLLYVVTCVGSYHLIQLL